MNVREPVVLMATAVLFGGNASPETTGQTSDTQFRSRALAQFANLPLAFEENRGQTDASARYFSRGSRYTLLLTRSGPVINLIPVRDGNVRSPAARLRMRLLNGASPRSIAGRDPLVTRTHYFNGNDARQWRTDVPNFQRVAYQDVYPGIDLVFYEIRGQSACTPGIRRSARHPTTRNHITPT
jgi:hypothetical protein